MCSPIEWLPRSRTRGLGLARRYELGDWAARLALAVLVYDETGSATAAGLVTAVGLLAWVGPGQLLSSLADRMSRRTVLVACDLVRAPAFGLAAVGVPLLVLVFVSGLATPPAESVAARCARRWCPRRRSRPCTI